MASGYQSKLFLTGNHTRPEQTANESKCFYPMVMMCATQDVNSIMPAT